MSYTVKTVYIPVDSYSTIGAPIAAGPSAPAGLSIGPKAVSRGLVVGIRARLADNTGSVGDTISLKLYEDDTSTEELYDASFTFAAVGETLSDTLNTPIPFFNQPYLVVDPLIANTEIRVTLYVEAIA